MPIHKSFFNAWLVGVFSSSLAPSSAQMGLTSPPAAIFSKPDAKRLGFPKEQRDQAVPLYLICDNVRDPGNLGTILRCAAATGCQSVLLTKGMTTRGRWRVCVPQQNGDCCCVEKAVGGIRGNGAERTM